MRHTLQTLGLIAALASVAAPVSAGELKVSYAHQLSDFNGTIPYQGVRVRVDGVRNEAYVLGDAIQIFTPSGMETYSFVPSPELGIVLDVAVEKSGDILMLTIPESLSGPKGFEIRRCDYRGALKSTIVPMLPDEVASFSPNQMLLRDGRFFLISRVQLRLVELRADGGFVKATDLAPVLGIDENERGTVDIGGFDITPRGDMLFTVPEHFEVVVVRADGKRGAFGTAGSAPGKFGVIGAVVGDAEGNIFVADKQRSVVIVFNSALKFVNEFGDYGVEDNNIVRPEALALTPAGRLYVSQVAGRGISVFDITTN